MKRYYLIKPLLHFSHCQIEIGDDDTPGQAGGDSRQSLEMPMMEELKRSYKLASTQLIAQHDGFFGGY